MNRIDLDRLSRSLRERIRQLDISERRAASEIGLSPATLSRMLRVEMTPDLDSVMLAVSWLRTTIAEFEVIERGPSVLDRLTDCESVCREVADQMGIAPLKIDLVADDLGLDRDGGGA